MFIFCRPLRNQAAPTNSTAQIRIDFSKETAKCNQASFLWSFIFFTVASMQLFLELLVTASRSCVESSSWKCCVPGSASHPQRCSRLHVAFVPEGWAKQGPTLLLKINSRTAGQGDTLINLWPDLQLDVGLCRYGPVLSRLTLPRPLGGLSRLQSRARCLGLESRRASPDVFEAELATKDPQFARTWQDLNKGVLPLLPPPSAVVAVASEASNPEAGIHF